MTAGELAALNLPATLVYLAENEINGLAFPEVPDSIVIFGLGYGVEVLSAIPWLAGVRLELERIPYGRLVHAL